MEYKTASGSIYTVINGRISNSRHGIDNEPVWRFHRTFDNCLRFRTPKGWYYTTHIVSKEAI